MIAPPLADMIIAMYAQHASNVIGLALLVGGFMILAFAMVGLAIVTFLLYKKSEEQDKVIKKQAKDIRRLKTSESSDVAD